MNFMEHDGPLSVEDIRIKMKVLDTFINASNEFGYKYQPDFNTGRQ